MYTPVPKSGVRPLKNMHFYILWKGSVVLTWLNLMIHVTRGAKDPNRKHSAVEARTIERRFYKTDTAYGERRMAIFRRNFVFDFQYIVDICE